MDPKIEHIIVLMLENRSFDHMLGWLDYLDAEKNKQFNGLLNLNKERRADLGIPDGYADFEIQPGPGHSHESAMLQIFGKKNPSDSDPRTMTGFRTDYREILEHYGLNEPGRDQDVMRCFDPLDQVRVLSTLARKFAVCNRWFSSLPGETWPNRHFAHAGTSSGTVAIITKWYENKTIFEQLTEQNRDWAIYYAAFPPEILAFGNLWWHRTRRSCFRSIKQLYRAIKNDKLPNYSFIEPDQLGSQSNSQHPWFGGEKDFRAAEKLIYEIYAALVENIHVFEKTLFLITYDEHGGFFDHEPPPRDEKYTVKEHYTSGDKTFKFDLLGTRVPAVLVSPWIKEKTICSTTFDHSSIIATICDVFDLDSKELSDRVQNVEKFNSILNLENARKQEELRTILSPQMFAVSIETNLTSAPDRIDEDPYAASLIWLLSNFLSAAESHSHDLYSEINISAQQLEGLEGTQPGLRERLNQAVGEFARRHTRETIESKVETSQTEGTDSVVVLQEVDNVLNHYYPTSDIDVEQYGGFDFVGENPKLEENLANLVSSIDKVLLDAGIKATITRADFVNPRSPIAIKEKYRWLKNLFLSWLENRRTADAAQEGFDLIFKSFVKKYLVLRKQNGMKVEILHEGEHEDEVMKELRFLFIQANKDKCIWLADHKIRWLTIHGDKELEFHDEDEDTAISFTISNGHLEQDIQQAFGLVQDFIAGRIKELKNVIRS